VRRLLPSFRWVPVSTSEREMRSSEGHARGRIDWTMWELRERYRARTHSWHLERRTPSCSPRRTQADTALTRPDYRPPGHTGHHKPVNQTVRHFAKALQSA
jgi:hypothetical protein